MLVWEGVLTMSKSLRVFILTVALMLLANAPAFAGVQDFVLVNNTGSTIYNVYCSPSGSNSWEEDILGDTGTIAPGASATIRFAPNENVQYWDLLVVFDNGVQYPFAEIDLFSVAEITVNSDATANFR